MADESLRHQSKFGEMMMRLRAVKAFFACWLVASGFSHAGPPVLRDSRLQLDLVAAEPEIVTPTGLAVDRLGRIWCLENHTHHRGPAYQGPTTDRLRVFEDFGPDGRARKAWTIAEGFRDAMGLTIGTDGAVYVATRAKILRLRFEHDKEVQREEIVRLETPGNYPHNGLCGFAWDGRGALIFGLGENLGETYRLIGSDGRTLTGGGEGGSMYRCRPDGRSLERIATGFWNPFAHCLNRDGQLFAVDNDPDARGPCRLLHVVEGGDYGYRFRYGRKGLHPFISWNGEWPGTLPMVAGTSEAPSGIVAADSAALPEAYAGELIVTSWGDHTIETFHLVPKGASFAGHSRVIVKGDQDFRPVALAVAPDGSIVLSDWVDQSYPVHGKGRIWRLRAKDSDLKRRMRSPLIETPQREEDLLSLALNGPTGPARASAIRQLRHPESVTKLIPLLAEEDPFLFSAVLTALGRPEHLPVIREVCARRDQPPRVRLGLMLALRRTGERQARADLPCFLEDPDPAVRRSAIQWAAEDNQRYLRGRIHQAALEPPVTRELIEAWTKADQMLSGTRGGAEESEAILVRRIVHDESLPSSVRALGLRMISPKSPFLSPDQLVSWVKSSDDLASEAIRSWALRDDEQNRMNWKSVLNHPSIETRRWAILGLASLTDQPEVRTELRRQLDDSDLRLDALRALRGCREEVEGVASWWEKHKTNLGEKQVGEELAEQVAVTLASMSRPALPPMADADRFRQAVVAGTGRVDEGERLFFHPKGPGCFKCHQIGARGSAVGPDLTLIGRSMSRDRLMESILDPEREVAPVFVRWEILTHEGISLVGVITGETHDSKVTLVDAEGRVHHVVRTAIEERRPLKGSIMPKDVAARMTPREFADLVAFLLTCR